MKYLILFALLGLARGDCSGTTWDTCTGNCFWDNGVCYPISDGSPFTSYDNYDVEPEDLAELQKLQDAFNASAIQMKLSDNGGTTEARIYTVLSLDGNISNISYCDGNSWFYGGTIDECNESDESHTENIFLLAKQLELIVQTFDAVYENDFSNYTYYCSNDGKEYAEEMGGDLCDDLCGDLCTNPPTCPGNTPCTCIDEDGSCDDGDDDWGYITFAHPAGGADPCDVNSYDKTECCLTKTVAAEYINAQCCDCS